MSAGPAERLSLRDVVGGLDVVRQLPAFLRHRISYESALATVKGRIERRSDTFIDIVRRRIWPQPSHPYRRLFEHAGVSPDDVESLVRKDGLEGALAALFGAGVYLTSAELKRREVVRGSLRFSISPHDLYDGAPGSTLTVQTSGSSGSPVSVLLDLASILAWTPNCRLMFDVRGGAEWPRASWTIPGAGGLSGQLWMQVCFGRGYDAWFTLVHPHVGVPARIRLSTPMIRAACRLLGARLEGPRYVPSENPQPVLDWLVAALRKGVVPHLSTYPTAALRLCEHAARSGVDLRGAQLLLRGEPLTPIRFAKLRDAGFEVQTVYGSTETMVIGYGCMDAEAVDDIHLMDDSHAAIHATNAQSSLPPEALLVTTLLPHVVMRLINFCVGDCATIERRVCGCGLQSCGWSTHLHTIRSFEKLTGSGMTFVHADIVTVLEEVLPRRFGGMSADYQVVEKEADNGVPVVELSIHPELGPIDEVEAKRVFLDAVGGAQGSDAVMREVWRKAGIVKVVRRPPLTNEAGKVLYFRPHRQSES